MPHLSSLPANAAFSLFASSFKGRARSTIDASDRSFPLKSAHSAGRYLSLPPRGEGGLPLTPHEGFSRLAPRGTDEA